MNNKSLELQSDRIEMALASHKAPARVTGGVVTPRAVQFHLAPAPGTKVNKVQSLANELALALGVASVRVSRQGSSVHLEVPRDDARPVRLLPLMSRMDARPLPLGTAVLGMCDDGAPLLLRLPSPDVAHVLISGTTGSGKMALCQTMILSLAMTHRRSQLQFVLVDPKRRAFAPFGTLPHLLRPIIDDATEAVDALRELVQLMEARGAGTPFPRIVSPRIMLILDEFDELAREVGEKLIHPLTHLIISGREAGIHAIVSTQGNGTLIRANFPVRLVGKVVSPEDARVVAGIGGTGAERLTGRGDFVAVAAGQVLRFQAAYVSLAEMEQVVAQLGSAPCRWDVIKGRSSLLHQAAALVAKAN